jgi:hypothetical protein
MQRTYIILVEAGQRQSTLVPVPENYSPPLCRASTGVLGDMVLLCQLQSTLQLVPE